MSRSLAPRSWGMRSGASCPFRISLSELVQITDFLFFWSRKFRAGDLAAFGGFDCLKVLRTFYLIRSQFLWPMNVKPVFAPPRQSGRIRRPSSAVISQIEPFAAAAPASIASAIALPAFPFIGWPSCQIRPLVGFGVMCGLLSSAVILAGRVGFAGLRLGWRLYFYGSFGLSHRVFWFQRRNLLAWSRRCGICAGFGLLGFLVQSSPFLRNAVVERQHPNSWRTRFSGTDPSTNFAYRCLSQPSCCYWSCQSSFPWPSPRPGTALSRILYHNAQTLTWNYENNHCHWHCSKTRHRAALHQSFIESDLPWAYFSTSCHWTCL